MASSDLVFQNFSSPQSGQQPAPVTIVAAANIIPTTKLTILTGTAALETIGTIVGDDVIPVQDGYHELVLLYTSSGVSAFLTTGNIAITATPVQNRPIMLYYNPIDKLYYPQTVA